MWLKEQIEKYKDDEDFILEEKILDITEQISKRMKKLNWNKKELATKLNVSQAWVTKLLKGNTNFTLRTLVKLSRILDFNICFKFESKEEVEHHEFGILKDHLTFKLDEFISTPLSSTISGVMDCIHDSAPTKENFEMVA